MAFKGFGSGTQEYFLELGKNNNKSWFEEHRSDYDNELREPAEAFIVDLGTQLSKTYPGIHFDTRRNGAGSLMRINRDVRFSADKRPYKENLGVIFWLGEGKKVEMPCFYFHIDADSCFFFGGQHIFPKEMVIRYREAVADPVKGQKLTTLLADLDRQGLPVFEEPAYKRVPRDYPADHPRADLLRFGGMGVARVLDGSAIRDAGLVAACAGDAVRMKPLLDWLAGVN